MLEIAALPLSEASASGRWRLARAGISVASRTAKSWPSIGASATTKRCPGFAWAASSLSDRAILIVLEEIWIAPASRLPMYYPH